MLDRTIAPAFKQNNKLEILKADIAQLSNGIQTYSVLGGQQDVIKIELVFKAGRWFEDKTGAAHFAANLISKGTKDRNSFDIARIFDLYGAHVEVNPGLDVVSVSLYSLTKNLKPVLEVLYEIISGSVFPEKELEQSMAIFLQNLKVNEEKTSFQASKLFRKNLFNDNHPYGKELDETVQSLTRKAIDDHYQHHFKDLFILISGKVNTEDTDLIRDTFSRIATNPSKSKSFSSGKTIPARTLEEKEGSIQSSIRMGKLFIGRNHPDYAKVLLLNHILGGYFGSRLMKNIREDKGFTYGIYSSIHTLVNDNYLVIGADVNKENLGPTFDEIKKELARLRTERISKEELETSRNHFIGSMQSEITTPFSHADKWRNIILYSLPTDYYSSLMNRILAIDADTIMETAETYFKEDSFLEVAVG